jgi:cobalt transporter subunit CbtA
MTIFRNAVLLAAVAGLVAGLAMALMQNLATVPLILQAETFESAGGHDHGHASAAEPHDHGSEEAGWKPGDGLPRVFFTTLANVVTAIGFALVLVVASELAGGIAGWRQGMLWGLAGFATVTLAPGLGLPPELPAMPVADLAARQVWWIGTAIATAAGLALLLLGRTVPLAVVGVALLVVPHLLGAPQPDSHDTPIPADLHRRFVAMVMVTNLVFWMLLGALVGGLRRRIATGPDLRTHPV